MNVDMLLYTKGFASPTPFVYKNHFTKTKSTHTKRINRCNGYNLAKRNVMNLIKLVDVPILF
jgi:hypothetical protein